MRKKRPASFKGYFKDISPKKLAVILAVVMGIFVLMNLLVLLSYKGKTYPGTKLNGISIGSVNKAELSTVISESKFFPSKLTLNVGSKTLTSSPSSLGITENTAAITNEIESHSWLPVANLFSVKNVKLALNVNNKTLSSALASIAAEANVAPIGAKISLVGSRFTLVSANNGYSLNETAAANVVVSDLKANKSVLVLPTIVADPSVTNASLQSQLSALEKTLSTPLTFSYNGKNSSPSSAQIASWYVPSGDSYVLSTAKIETYLKGIGQTDGISVQNIALAATNAEASINKGSSLSFALQPVPNTACSPNSLSQRIIVSISQRHLWVCSGPNQVYDSAVVTGDEQYADTLTPPGTYHIYAMETNKTLTGSDENGSWSDFVNYWMPFLYNQYGAYGFHDATWRPANAFGSIDPNSSNASNGCVELPLATAQWIYKWASVGTTVTIES